MAVGDGKGGMAHTERRQRARADSLMEGAEGTEPKGTEDMVEGETSEEEGFEDGSDEDDENGAPTADGRRMTTRPGTGLDELASSMAALRFVPPSVSRELLKGKGPAKLVSKR